MEFKAIEFTYKHHKEQRDKIGIPYIYHVMAVARNFEDFFYRLVAVLHDIIEDTKVTKTQLVKEFGFKVADHVEILTRKKNENYLDYVTRCKGNTITKEIKKADIEDHLKYLHLVKDQKTKERLEKKYEQALILLGE